MDGRTIWVAEEDHGHLGRLRIALSTELRLSRPIPMWVLVAALTVLADQHPAELDVIARRIVSEKNIQDAAAG